MSYQILVLDLDGTLTNSRKEITPPTREALLQLQQSGKKVVLASGRPTPGVLPLAEELELARYGGYILSFNGARIISCRDGRPIYNRTLPPDVIRPVYELAHPYDADIITYAADAILSGGHVNQYSELEARINRLPIRQPDYWPEAITFPINKILLSGEAALMAELEEVMKKHFHSYLNIYRSDPYYLEIMPPQIDKAYSLQKLLNSIGMTADEMICCGDGYNDISMIEYAGLGVAMANAQPVLLEKADFITKSNDEDGVLHVILHFMME